MSSARFGWAWKASAQKRAEAPWSFLSWHIWAKPSDSAASAGLSLTAEHRRELRDPVRPAARLAHPSRGGIIANRGSFDS